MSVGIKNRNWLNIKRGNSDWRGMIGVDARGHAIFEAPEWSIRAGIRLLRTYRKSGLDTVASILARWAPATDTLGSIPGMPANTPAAYARFVSQRMGVAATEKLGLFQADGVRLSARGEDLLPRMLMAMAIYELGHAATRDMDHRVIERGIALYRSETEPKKESGARA